MKRFEKQELISELNGIFSKANSVFVVHYKGLTVAQMEEFRDIVSKSEMGFKVVKNSLSVLALQETKNNVLDKFFVGPTAIAWGEDPVLCAKTIDSFAKNNSNLVIVGGSYNSSSLSAEDVSMLASLPSFDEIRGKLVGLLTAAASKIVTLAKAPASEVVGVLEAYSKKD